MTVGGRGFKYCLSHGNLSNFSLKVFRVICCVHSQQNGQLAGVTANDSISAFLIGEGSTIAAFVASRRESLRIDDLQPGDSRFPDGIFPTAAGDRVGEGKDLVHSVIAYPVLVNDELVGVLAAYRIVGRLPFTLYHEMVSFDNYTVKVYIFLCFILKIMKACAVTAV